MVQEEELPKGCHRYRYSEEVPEELRRYWWQRASLFSKFDQGIWLTDDAWYGVTPEAVANTIAADFEYAASPEKKILIDAFAGVGGNAIAFALSGIWEQIFAIEKDPEVLKCAKHNAEIYGVSKMIWWIEGDCFDIIPERFRAKAKDAVVFASPPWGGPKYRGDEIFDLSKMEPYNLKTLHALLSKWFTEFAIYLPRSADLNQIAQLTTEDKKLPVRHYCTRKASKALCVYFGAFNME